MTLRSEGRRGLNYTVALGLDDVMDELRMDYQSASIDAETAEALLNEERDGAAPVETGDSGNTEEPATF